MNIDDIIEIGNSKMNLALVSYTASFLAVSIITVLMIMLLKNRKQGIMSNSKKIVGMIMFTFILFSSMNQGINAHIIANKIEKDIQDMNSYSLSGTIDDIYAEAKTLFVVIDSESYICGESYLNTDASVGKKYNIKYLENSKLIIEMEEIN